MLEFGKLPALAELKTGLQACGIAAKMDIHFERVFGTNRRTGRVNEGQATQPLPARL